MNRSYCIVPALLGLALALLFIATGDGVCLFLSLVMFRLASVWHPTVRRLAAVEVALLSGLLANKPPRAICGDGGGGVR